MSADMRAAMETARTLVEIADENQNLAAAFLEVTAELEQERKAREETQNLARNWLTELKKAEQRSAELQARLDMVEAETIKRCAKAAKRWGKRNGNMGGWQVAAGYIVEEIRALAAAGQTESAARQEANFDCVTCGLDSESKPALAADRVEMVSVPRRPTEAMIQAGYNFALGTSWPDDWYVGGATPELYTALGVWEAMIASADQAAATQANKESAATQVRDVQPPLGESPGPAPAADPALPGLELALGLFAEDTWGANTIRAEIERRTK